MTHLRNLPVIEIEAVQWFQRFHCWSYSQLTHWRATRCFWLANVLFVFALTLVGLVAWLHPARAALSPTRQYDPQYPLLGLTLLIAVPILWLAGNYQWAQFTLENTLAADWYYGGLTMHLVFIVVLSAIASVDGAHRRTLLAASIFLAGPLALASVIYPNDPLSLGVVGGALVLCWCLTVGLTWFRSSERL